ncbi:MULTISPECIES: glutathione peroxidase [unclassified Capnocytophaga]|uniref:glutathione peroxidase n=1 Tax=unclassified Capnocytophaga TaxID=2640652 RepID=UPI000202BFB7|nr:MULTISPECIES: glutathione peroxidase [unclassified Capnocytophaga]EGD35252.1 glutathione peroxidase [Capnocytophaga sp. oral taxon 338 str. F0234]MEB3003869.1 glutathione peroxidase [Capnocytophaga sp. G2]
MKNVLTLVLVALCTFVLQGQTSDNTIYSFKVRDLYGKVFDFASLKGKKVMIVNTASKCGLTPQYKSLEALYQKYKDKDFVIIGFPSNSFEQELSNEAQVAQFCQANYGVTFPMMEIITVKGEKMHPLYQFLTQKKLNMVTDSQVQWNFQKYLIGKNGMLEKVIPPKTLPDTPEILQWIEK